MTPLHFAPLLASFAAGMLFAQDPPRKPDTTAPVLTTQQKGSARCKASQLIGCEITNSKNESLGEIQDIVLDNENRKIAYAVVGFGGFLGMGEKYFAMPWRLIQIDQRSTDDRPRATLGLDHATLKDAPGFDKSKWPDMANSVWAEQVDTYYRSRGENARPDGATEPKGSGVDGSRGIDRAPGSKQFTMRRLSTLIGTDVVDQHRKQVAEIEDLVVDARTATIDGALLSFGGTLGVGETLVLIAAESMTIDHAKGVFVLPCTTAGLTAMALPDNKWPPLNTEAWRTTSLEHCAKMNAAAARSGAVPVDASSRRLETSADRYDTTVVQSIAGSIVTIGFAQFGDRPAERLRMRVRATDGSEILVYGAPVSFADQQALTLRAGTEVAVEGSPARDGSRTVLIAGSITANGKTAVLHDAEGRPTWTKGK